MSDSFHTLRGSWTRLSIRRVCSSGPTSSQYLSRVIPESTIAFSTFFFSSRRRHTRSDHDWSSDVCSSDLSSVGCGLDERFGFAWSPGFVEPWFEGAVEPQDGEPSLAGDRSRPVRFLAVGGAGAEVEVN